MPTWFVVALDTTAPQVTLGEPSGLEAGQLFTVPYTVDEPAEITAELRSPRGHSHVANVSSTEITYELPQNWQGGTSTLFVYATDDVGNTSTKTQTYSITGVEAEIEGSGGATEIYIGGPHLEAPLEERFSGHVTLSREIELRVPGVVAYKTRILSFEERLTGNLSLAQNAEIRFQGSRLPSLRLTNLRREDEEILLVI